MMCFLAIDSRVLLRTLAHSAMARRIEVKHVKKVIEKASKKPAAAKKLKTAEPVPRETH